MILNFNFLKIIMTTLIKTYSEQILGKRKRKSKKFDFNRTKSDTLLINYKSKKINFDIDILFDKVMSIQINNAIKIFIKDYNYYLFPLSKIYNFFDTENEIKYFLNHIYKFGYNFIGKNNNNLYFEKNNNFLQDIIENSITTINNNFVFNFNYLSESSCTNVYNFIRSSELFEILRCDLYLGILVFKLII